MTTPAQIKPDADEAVLHECLSRSPAIGSPVIRLDRTRLDSSTSYETSLLTAELADGRELKVFLKDFAHSVRPKDDPRMRREREMRFYRDLAPAGELGTPKYYGSVWDPPHGRHWLLIEYVEGTPVRYCEFPHWHLATLWLGKLHGHFSRQLDRLRSCGFLQQHDERFFTSKASESLAAVERVSPGLAARLREALRDYGNVVRTMVGQPRTLVHGGYRPINVLTKIVADPNRTCVIDWEEVGLGAPLSDLAYYVDGFEGERLEELLAAYIAGAGEYGLALPPRREMMDVIACFRLHKLVHSLQKYVQWGVPESAVARLVGQVEEYASGERMKDAAIIPASQVVANADVASAVEVLLLRSLDRPSLVASLRRRPSEFATLSPAERVTVGLEDGRQIDLFVKHAGDEQADHPDKQRRDREVLVYEQILSAAGDGLPAPRYYGTWRNIVTGRRELYLEFIDDWSLQYHSLEHWITAAGRLADLHARLARLPANLLGSDFLLRLDETYFADWARRAAVAMNQSYPELMNRVAHLADRCGRAFCLLAQQPPTLVHNDLSPKNVIAARDETPARIFLVDWEMAGVGCGLLDLVHLKYGLDPESERRMLVQYRSGVAEAGLLPSQESEFSALLAACELHKTLYRLAHSPTWHLPSGRVAHWVDEAEVFLDRADGADA